MKRISTIVIAGLLLTTFTSTAQNWQSVGTEGFSSLGSQSVAIALDHNGNPYVAFADSANSQKVTVMKFDGTDWITVGSPGFSAGDAYDISIAINSSSTP